jgi:hypothetical protein
MRAESYARLTIPELVPATLRFGQMTCLTGARTWNPAGAETAFCHLRALAPFKYTAGAADVARTALFNGRETGVVCGSQRK